MPTATRLANKTIWCLDEISIRAVDACAQWSRAFERAQQRMDPLMLQALAGLRHELAEIERLARDGRRGEYAGRGE